MPSPVQDVVPPGEDEAATSAEDGTVAPGKRRVWQCEMCKHINLQSEHLIARACQKCQENAEREEEQQRYQQQRVASAAVAMDQAYKQQLRQQQLHQQLKHEAEQQQQQQQWVASAALAMDQGNQAYQQQLRQQQLHQQLKHEAEQQQQQQQQQQWVASAALALQELSDQRSLLEEELRLTKSELARVMQDTVSMGGSPREGHDAGLFPAPGRAVEEEVGEAAEAANDTLGSEPWKQTRKRKRDNCFVPFDPSKVENGLNPTGRATMLLFLLKVMFGGDWKSACKALVGVAARWERRKKLLPGPWDDLWGPELIGATAVLFPNFTRCYTYKFEQGMTLDFLAEEVEAVAWLDVDLEAALTGNIPSFDRSGCCSSWSAFHVTFVAGLCEAFLLVECPDALPTLLRNMSLTRTGKKLTGAKPDYQDLRHGCDNGLNGAGCCAGCHGGVGMNTDNRDDGGVFRILKAELKRAVAAVRWGEDPVSALGNFVSIINAHRHMSEESRKALLQLGAPGAGSVASRIRDQLPADFANDLPKESGESCAAC